MTKHRAILVLGQKKAGTTSLHSAIAATGLPLIDIPKESSVMNSTAKLRRLLARAAPDAVLLDATTTYFQNGAFSPDFVRSLALFAEVTVVFIYREETARLASHYRHSVNYDGWRDSAEAFVRSEEYLHHARLSPVVDAVRALGIDDIRVFPFTVLEEPGELAKAVAEITGVTPHLADFSPKNSFGSLQVMPRPVQKFLSTPVYQVVLRPLISTRLRAALKRLLGSKNVAVDLTDLDRPEIRKVAQAINAENAALLSAITKGGAER